MEEDQMMNGWLAAIIESADDAIISKTLDGIITSWNKSAEKILGYTADEIVGRPVLTLIPPERHGEETEILSKIRLGERIEHYETVRVTKSGEPLDVTLTVSPIKDEKGRIIGASKILRDITEQKRALAKLQEETEVIETINRVAVRLSAELDTEKLVKFVTDAATDLTGADFGAFFYNVVDDHGGSYMLYALSGVPREVFADFPMPRATELFDPTFRGEATIRVADVREDPRFGKNEPHFGMPGGHLPVVSYLAVSVVSRTHEVIGGLFFGHAAAGMFTDRHERIVEGLAGQAAVAMDNARLYESAQRAIKERDDLLAREQSARAAAEVASRAKDEFLSMLSHELRTPLNSILGWTRLLIDGDGDRSTETLHALEAVDRNAKLQARLIDDMLDVSRIISGKLRLDAQPVDLTTVINSAVDTLRPAADAKQLRLYVTLDFGSGTVLGDPVRLQQVVWNLLSNAIKFTGKEGSIRVSLQRVNSHVELTVSDSGPGIEENFLPYVFDRFRQEDSTTRKKFGGLGLGLSIVRHLVELHGGTVEAANRDDGPGAVFTVRLPVMAVGKLAAAAEKRSSEPEPVLQPAVIESLPRMDGFKVLAVDDEPDARHLLMTLFKRCGAEVAACGTAAETLQLLKTFEPDILVSDIGLPEEDGYSLIRKIRGNEKDSDKRLPAIALTAYARSEDRLKALSAGYNMYISKPVEPAELALVVYRMLR